MSAEKEIVNFWYNRKGFFTINNLKTSHNKDVGILAIEFRNEKVENVYHIQVLCSITNNIAENDDIKKSIGSIVNEKFNCSPVNSAIKKNVINISFDASKVKKVIVLGSMPKSRKSGIINKFAENEISVVEFEDVIYDVLANLDSQYYKNDIIRVLQLTKFLLLREPSKLAKLISNDKFSHSSRRDFIAQLISEDEIVKEFKKTNVERLCAIIKSSGIKTNELAKMIETGILNNRTRKAFIDSMMENEPKAKLPKKIPRKDFELNRFIE